MSRRVVHLDHVVLADDRSVDAHHHQAIAQVNRKLLRVEVFIARETDRHNCLTHGLLQSDPDADQTLIVRHYGWRNLH